MQKHTYRERHCIGNLSACFNGDADELIVYSLSNVENIFNFNFSTECHLMEFNYGIFSIGSFCEN